MPTKSSKRHIAILALTVLTGTGVLLKEMPVRGDQQVQGLYAQDFQYAAERGFGDRDNSWAQGMIWWNEALYVSTGREAVCSSYFALWQYVSFVVGVDFANTWLPYPPPSQAPELECDPDGADLDLAAQIWRWTPTPEGWSKVFESPVELPNPGPGDPAPAAMRGPRVGKFLPYETSFRGFAAHTEPDGTNALYAFGVNSTMLWDRNQLPPPRILRTTDGINWDPLPQTPGTFLGDLPFNPDHSSFRSPASFNGKLFVLSGPAFGQGSLIASADPAKGDDAWFLAADPAIQFYEIAAFNGFLYVGTLDADGYAIFKTRAEGPPPYELIPVVPPGACLADLPSKSTVSMEVFGGRLYVGTATFTEIIAINPDDTWDLIIGAPRQCGSEWKYPRSGLAAGFGQTLNDHAWQMDDRKGHLYVSTYNAATPSRHEPLGSLLEHNMGAHVYQTVNGWYYNAVTTNGFANLDTDGKGGKYDYGIRTMATTPYGLFFGTVNDYYGLMILRSPQFKTAQPNPADRFDIEPAGTTGFPLLSWRGSQSQYNKKMSREFQVWRAEVHDILLRDNVNFEGWNGLNGNKIRDTYVGPYTLIATVTDTDYVDMSVEAGKRYMYYIVERLNGATAPPSNLAAFPLLTPAVTFAELLAQLDSVYARGRWYGDASLFAAFRANVVTAQQLAADCQVSKAAQLLAKQSPQASVLDPEATDVQVLINKLVRRLQLHKSYPLYVANSEFCG